MVPSGRNRVSVKSERLRAVSVREITHNDHAIKAALRELILLNIRPCSRTPAVITLLYSTLDPLSLRVSDYDVRRKAALALAVAEPHVMLQKAARSATISRPAHQDGP